MIEIERVMHMVNAINLHTYVQLLYHVSNLLTGTCTCVSNLSAHYACTHIVSLAIINLFSLLNARANTNHLYYKTRSTVAIYEITHCCMYIGILILGLEFVYTYFIIQNIEILGIKSKLWFH